MANLKMVSPWINYYEEVKAMFGEDCRVNVVFNEDEMTLKLYVEGDMKAEAISILMPHEREYGNVTLKIEVIPSNDRKANLRSHSGLKRTFDPSGNQYEYYESLFRTAFSGSATITYTRVITGFMDFNAAYIVFRKAVVQYHNDDISDVNGKKSTLYECIARDIFEVPTGVYFCTDTEDYYSNEPRPLNHGYYHDD